MTRMKGVSSMKPQRDLEITQKSAWHLAHPTRKTRKGGGTPMFHDPAGADEIYFEEKRKELSGRGTFGNRLRYADSVS